METLVLNLPRFAALLLALTTVGCVAKKIPFEVTPAKKVENLINSDTPRDEATLPPGTETNIPDPHAKFLEGTLIGLDGSVIELATMRERPLVLMMASFTCGECAEEAAEFKARLQDNSDLADKVQLISLVIGGFVEDAADWQDRNDVPWTVVVQESDVLFNQLCTGGKTPCTLAQTPRRGVVYQHVGLSTWREVMTKLGFTVPEVNE